MIKTTVPFSLIRRTMNRSFSYWYRASFPKSVDKEVFLMYSINKVYTISYILS